MTQPENEPLELVVLGGGPGGYPALSVTLMEAAEGIIGRATHVYRPRR